MTVNAHTHLYSGLAPFLMEDRRSRLSGQAGLPVLHPLLRILQNFWWVLDRALDETSLRAAARYYVAEARRLGTTVLIDHHESPNFIEGSLDILADACQEFGMRALLCYGATERNGGRDEARRGLAECRRFIESNRRPLVRGAIGLHAAFTVSDETIEDAGRLCRELDVPLYVHVAEDRIDSDGFARLIANDAIVPGSILAHGVHLSRNEVEAAGWLRCWFVQNPRSNRANGVGYAHVLRNASRVALGTDGFPSDMAEEARALEKVSEAAARLTAGWELAATLFGDAPPSVCAAFDLEQIRAEAAQQAIRLAERMQGVLHEESALEEQRR